jgi:hypothetical protein
VDEKGTQPTPNQSDEKIDPSDEEKKAYEELFSIHPDLEKYLPQVKEFIKTHHHVLATIARDPSIDYRPAQRFVFVPKEGTIGLDVLDWKWAEEMGLEHDQLFWLTLHEIAHFRDMAEDPEGMLAVFDYLPTKAKELAPKALEIFTDRFGDKLPSYIDLTFVENLLTEELHSLYNFLDDIYVNRLVALDSPSFSPGKRGGKLVQELYRNFLFPASTKIEIDPKTLQITTRPVASNPEDVVNYTTDPLCHQTIYHLLRSSMVPDQKILVAPHVEDALNRPTDLIAKRSVTEEVKIITQPSGKYDRIQHNCTWRYRQIKMLIEPIFIELLMKDLANLPLPPPPIPPQPKEGQGEPPPEIEFNWEPGMKVRDKKTGRVGHINKINDDGSVEVIFEGETNE